MDEFKPDLAIGTTPVVQKAKELAIPALYFTNLISARPLMGPAGAGSLAQSSTRRSPTSPLRQDEGFLRRRRPGRHGRHLGRHAEDRPEFREEIREAKAHASKKPAPIKRPERGKRGEHRC
jgi:chlorophyllide a reductase subunit Y